MITKEKVVPLLIALNIGLTLSLIYVSLKYNNLKDVLSIMAVAGQTNPGAPMEGIETPKSSVPPLVSK
jgi:hypothetical protein